MVGGEHVAAGPRRLKAPILAVRTAQHWHVFALAELSRRAGAGGVWSATVDGVDVRFACQTEPAAVVWAEVAPGEPLQVVRCCWFAWYALHPAGVADWEDEGNEAMRQQRGGEGRSGRRMGGICELLAKNGE
jgi:hypothetical protein